MLIGVALFASPFVTYRANRIVAGEGTHADRGAAAVQAALGISPSASASRSCAALVRNPLAAPRGRHPRPRHGLPGRRMVRRLRHAGRQHLRAGFARRSASGSSLSPSHCSAADSLTRLRLGPWARLAALAVAAGAVAASAALRGLERPVAAQGIRHPRRQLLAGGAPAPVPGLRLAGGGRASSGCRSASSATASGACGRRSCRFSTSSRRFRASRSSAS